MGLKIIMCSVGCEDVCCTMLHFESPVYQVPVLLFVYECVSNGFSSPKKECWGDDSVSKVLAMQPS